MQFVVFGQRRGRLFEISHWTTARIVCLNLPSISKTSGYSKQFKFNKKIRFGKVAEVFLHPKRNSKDLCIPVLKYYSRKNVWGPQSTTGKNSYLIPGFAYNNGKVKAHWRKDQENSEQQNRSHFHEDGKDNIGKANIINYIATNHWIHVSWIMIKNTAYEKKPRNNFEIICFCCSLWLDYLSRRPVKRFFLRLYSRIHIHIYTCHMLTCFLFLVLWKIKTPI